MRWPLPSLYLRRGDTCLNICLEHRFVMQMRAAGMVVDERGTAGKLVSITIGATMQPCRASQPCDVTCELATLDRKEAAIVNSSTGSALTM